MSARNWIVEVDGVKHAIVVDVDPQSRRATIRVDGRIAAKPMGAEESERELPVGSAHYVVRRQENDAFDLDIPPEVFLNRSAAAKTPGARRPTMGGHAPKPESKSTVKRVIGGVFLALVVLGLLRYGVRGYQYTRVPWQAYAEPDGSFQAQFPAVPKNDEETENINGDRWMLKIRSSEYKNHFYAVEYLDLKIPVVAANAQAVMSDFLGGWAEAVGGKIVSTEKSSVARNQALDFQMTLPKGSGGETHKLEVPALMRGRAAVRESRLFIAWTLAAEEDPFSTDLLHFIDQFQLPPPPAPARLGVVVRPVVETPVPEPATVSSAPDGESEARRTEAETAARRAAQPQIILEPVFLMYHVAGCQAVTSQMRKVSREELPRGYDAHLCVPEEVRNWRRSRQNLINARPG